TACYSVRPAKRRGFEKECPTAHTLSPRRGWALRREPSWTEPLVLLPLSPWGFDPTPGLPLSPSKPCTGRPSSLYPPMPSFFSLRSEAVPVLAQRAQQTSSTRSCLSQLIVN